MFPIARHVTGDYFQTTVRCVRGTFTLFTIRVPYIVSIFSFKLNEKQTNISDLVRLSERSFTRPWSILHEIPKFRIVSKF